MMFETFTDAADVLKRGRPLEFKSLAFTMQKIERDISFVSCGVEISGISRNTSRDHLLAVFENPRMSGGDECEDLFFDPENNRAVVTYKDIKGRNMRWIIDEMCDRMHYGMSTLSNTNYELDSILRWG